MSNFHFLFEEFSALGRAAQEAERQVYFSPTASCAFSRKALEMALRWMIEHDPEIEVPEDYSLYLLLTGGDLARLLSPTRCKELDVVRRMGNRGLHEDWLDEPQAKMALRYLHGFLTWLYESYTQEYEAEIPVSPFRVGQIPSLNQAGGAELISGVSEGPALELAMRPPLPKAQLSAPEQRVSEQRTARAREQRADDGMRASLLGSGGGFGGRGNSWFADLWEWFRSLFGRSSHSRSGGRFSVEYDREPMRGSRAAPAKSEERSFKGIFDESGDQQLSMAMEPPPVYSRREGVSNMRTAGVSESTTEQMFIETLLREAGWGSRLDRQEELLQNRDVSASLSADLNADWDFMSPYWVTVIFSDSLLPELIIVDAALMSNADSPLMVIRSGLEKYALNSARLVSDDNNGVSWDRLWISEVAVYFMEGIKLSRYNYHNDELVPVEEGELRIGPDSLD